MLCLSIGLAGPEQDGEAVNVAKLAVNCAIALMLTSGMAACKDEPVAKPAEQTGAANTSATSDAKTDKADPHDAFTDVSVDEVDKLLATKACTPVDVNGASTREKYGTLPGALLIDSSDAYDVATLPKEKDANLVFYCGSQKCSAAPTAAVVAQKAGYTNVKVMRAGIRGWVDAGKAADKPAT